MAHNKASPPWSDAEKIQLLLEITKQVTEPNWRSINIPEGRTKLQAQQIFTIMKSHVGPPTEGDEALMSSPNTKKRPREEPPNSDVVNNAEAQKGQSASSTGLEAHVAKRKRGRPTKAESEARKAAEARGEILPKPKLYVPKTASPLVVGADGQVKRRRGRPTKAEAELKRAQEKESKKKQQAEETKKEEQEQQPEPPQTKESEQQPEEEDEEDEEDEDDE